jgi:hypothetical protein
METSSPAEFMEGSRSFFVGSMEFKPLPPIKYIIASPDPLVSHLEWC